MAGKELAEWTGIAHGYGLSVKADGDASWRLKVFSNRYILIRKSGDTYLLSGDLEIVNHLEQTFHSIRRGDVLYLSKGQVQDRIKEVCKFAVAESQQQGIVKRRKIFINTIGEILKEGMSEIDAISKQRIGQEILRKELLVSRGKCEASGTSIHSLLVASHIRDWAESDDDQRFDLENVLLLAANWDALFDKKFISFDPETGKMIRSDRIDDKTLRKFGVPDDWRETVSVPIKTEQRKEYLRWHNKLMAKEDAKFSKKHNAEG